MAEEKNMTATAEAEAAEMETKSETPYLLKLAKPYVFEGKEYAEIDLGGLDKLTVQAAIDAQKQVFSEREMAATILSETTTAFSRALAAKATGLPIEFFKLAPRSVSHKIHNMVMNYLNVDENTENHVMKLEKPYHFNGQQYMEIDLNGVANLNSLNESEAENRLTRAGFVVTGTSSNYYLYACTIASMATGLPEEFFTGLPLYEVLKIKNAVNDADFFE